MFEWLYHGKNLKRCYYRPVRIRTFNFKNELIDDKTCDFWVDLDEAIEAVLVDLANSKLKRVEIEKVSNWK